VPLSRCERASFTDQKWLFWKVKEALLKHPFQTPDYQQVTGAIFRTFPVFASCMNMHFAKCQKSKFSKKSNLKGPKDVKDFKDLKDVKDLKKALQRKKTAACAVCASGG
jgi:hypothetical protein